MIQLAADMNFIYVYIHTYTHIYIYIHSNIYILKLIIDYTWLWQGDQYNQLT